MCALELVFTVKGNSMINSLLCSTFVAFFTDNIFCTMFSLFHGDTEYKIVVL